MKYNKLGSSDLLVSEVCLGSMTWGVQNTEEEAHEQIDYAISCGVNFIDTAEVYPVPATDPVHVYGRTEEIIGSYLAKHPGVREKLIIATKVPGHYDNEDVATKVTNRRYDPPTQKKHFTLRQNRESILDACEGSLRRLQTDYIDLYQLHWPDRYVPMFGRRDYNPQHEKESTPFREILLALKTLLDAGKIRAYGLSNETTFGVCQIVRIADELGMPRPATIQNSFCLLNRQFEGELAEACAPSNFNIGLLPLSILAGGALTGKYNTGVDKDFKVLDKSLEKSRFVLYRDMHYQSRYITDKSLNAIEEYMKIAKKAGISVATLAQAFCKSRWYIPSSLVGATKLEQLKENIAAFEVELDQEVLDEIDAVHNLSKDIAISV